jgi:DNA repair protein RecO (recombination protein O)
MRVVNEPAYVLESRPYRETSLLLDVLTREHGRLAMVAKGARAASRQHVQRRALLESFRLVHASFSGRGEVLTLGSVESGGLPLHPVGNALFAGLYVNEIVQKTTGRGDPAPMLFDRYGTWLGELAAVMTADDSARMQGGSSVPASGSAALLEWSLRRFERDLLEILGYGLALDHDGESGEPVDPDVEYAFDPAHGARSWQPGGHWARTKGEVLLAWSGEARPDADTLAALKLLARQVIRHQLGGVEPRTWKLAAEWRSANR